MSAAPSEKALRCLVAELAAAAPDDIEAVLDALSERHREKVVGLLASYRGEVVELPKPQSPDHGATIEIEGLSPWLAARLDRRAQTSIARPGMLDGITTAEARDLGVEYAMTPTAHEALRAAATTVQAALKDDHPPAASWSSAARKSLLGRRAAR